MKKYLSLLLGGILLLFVGATLGIFYVCDGKWCFTVEQEEKPVVNSFEECVSQGFPVMESFPRQCRAGERTFTEEIGGNIHVLQPAEHDIVKSPLVIRGQARVFENAFSYRLRDADGSILVEGFDMSASPDVGLFGPFEVHVEFPKPKGAWGTVEVFNYSAKDGAEENMVIVPVRFGA